jgi:hypothetical protein
MAAGDGGNVNDDAVMCKAIQDPGLYKIYEGLPQLKYVFVLGRLIMVS